MVRTSDHDKAHVGAGEHVGQMLGSVRDCRQSLFGPSADRVHDHVEYSLTEVGKSLRPIIGPIGTFVVLITVARPCGSRRVGLSFLSRGK